MPIALLDSTALGALLALTTAIAWAISPVCFASAGRKIGSFPVTLLRCGGAAILLLAILPIYGMLVAIAPPSLMQVIYLATSGFFGMVIGDILLFEAFVLIGPRRTTQTVVLAPIPAILIGWFYLDETLSLQTLTGIALALAGTFYAVLRRPDVETAHEPMRISPMGLLMAIGGSICVGIGGVAARAAYQEREGLDPVLATTIRVNASAVMLWLVPIVLGRAPKLIGHLRDTYVLSRVGLGTLIGPFGGMLTYLWAFKMAKAGPTATLASMSPLFILPILAIRYHTRVPIDVIVAAIVACTGVAMIFLR